MLLHNPGAGDEKHTAKSLCALVRGAGHEVVYRSLDEAGWEKPLDNPPDLVAVAGGDGAVGKVLRRLAGSSVPAALLPLGTANNIATALGLTADLDELVSGWAEGVNRRYDLGTVTVPGTCEARFVESVGGGLIAEAIARAGDAAGEREDKVDLGLRVLRELVAVVEARPWRLRLDGADESRDLLAVEAMLIGRAGPGIPLAGAAEVGDGLLDVVLLGEAEREPLATYIDERLSGGSAAPAQVPVRRARNVELVPPEGAHLRVDDEAVASNGPVRASTGALSTGILMPRTTGLHKGSILCSHSRQHPHR